MSRFIPPLFLFGLLAVNLSSAVATAALPDVPAPTLIQCRTDSTCDRNPQHLEAFVAGFYRWYIANDIKFYSYADPKLSSEEQKKLIKDFTKNETSVMQESLTPAFYNWTKIYTSTKSPASDSRYCPPETNVITCAQDEFNEWLNATAQLVSINGDTAQILVGLPSPPIESGKMLFHRLSVQLKVEQGIWQIDSVRRSSPWITNSANDLTPDIGK